MLIQKGVPLFELVRGAEEIFYNVGWCVRDESWAMSRETA
jgi:hypothetical protein